MLRIGKVAEVVGKGKGRTSTMRPKAELLRKRLLEMVDALPTGERIPAERILCQQLDVARETLRRVLDDLVEEGRLERRRGAGTFVVRPKILQQLRVQSFTEDMRARGMSASSKLLAHRREVAGARLGAQLQISPGEEVLTLQRLRLADGESMALELVHIPAALVPGLSVESLGHQSLYTTLRREYDIELWGGTQTMEATVLDAEEAVALGVPPLSPALLVERVTWMRSGRRIEAAKSVYRGDRYKFQADLRTPNDLES